MAIEVVHDSDFLGKTEYMAWQLRCKRGIEGKRPEKRGARALPSSAAAAAMADGLWRMDREGECEGERVRERVARAANASRFKARQGSGAGRPCGVCWRPWRGLGRHRAPRAHEGEGRRRPGRELALS